MVGMIEDQRHIYGGRTPEEVRARWGDLVYEANRAREIRNLPVIRLQHTGETVSARINHGRWIADCVCGGGMGAWVENPLVACLDCGSVYYVDFPPELDREVAEALLLGRPEERNRNWAPELEPVDELRAENERCINGLV